MMKRPSTVFARPAVKRSRKSSADEFSQQVLWTARQRFPNVLVTKRGTIIAAWGSKSVCVRRSVDAGVTFGDEIHVAPGIHSGGLTVDEATGALLLFVEAMHPPAPITVYRSEDEGETWHPFSATFHKDCRGAVPNLHMNESGLTLMTGRLIRPARVYGVSQSAGGGGSSNYHKRRAKDDCAYCTALVSDDHGETWQSNVIPGFGFGEAALAELRDGTVIYNARRHWASGFKPLKRYVARSTDGGETFSSLSQVPALPDGPQNTRYGLMGGLCRVLDDSKDILVYSSCDSAKGRKRGTVWVSFDGGATWPVKRRVTDGKFAYSSLAAGRPGTVTAGWIYLLYEGGESGWPPRPTQGVIARFSLEWLKNGEMTEDGSLPRPRY